MSIDRPDNDDLEQELDDIERLVQDNRQPEIIELCNRLEARFPRRFELYFHRAQARSLSGDSAGALVDVSTAISLQPKEPALFFFRGTWHLNGGRIEDGVDDLTRVLALEESLGTSYYADSALFARAVGWLYLGEFEASRRDCDGVRPDITGFVRGRVWKVADVRKHATQQLLPR